MDGEIQRTTISGGNETIQRLEQENKELRTRVAGAYEQGKKDGKIESFELAIKIAETFEPEERQTYIKYASDAIRELKGAVKESRT